MNSLKRYLSFCLSWATMVLLCQGQAPALQRAAPPPSRIMDQGGFFTRDTGAFKRISEKLLKLDQDHGFKIYLVVEPVLITTSAPELAAELRQQWVPDGNGLVLVYESNNHNLGVGRDMAGGPGLKDIPARIPSHETTAMLNRATVSTGSEKGKDSFLETLIGNVVDECEGYFKRRAAPTPPERSMKIGLLVIGTLSLLGLALIGLGALVRHSSMAGVRSFRFPVVDRPERLGAPCGSSVTARGFGPQRHR